MKIKENPHYFNSASLPALQMDMLKMYRELRVIVATTGVAETEIPYIVFDLLIQYVTASMSVDEKLMRSVMYQDAQENDQSKDIATHKRFIIDKVLQYSGNLPETLPALTKDRVRCFIHIYIDNYDVHEIMASIDCTENYVSYHYYKTIQILACAFDLIVSEIYAEKTPHRRTG